mmetsp:Transcript_76731/g.206772  ORF Transcript_76731/g.206772 Transcript_76731/m.206772 type:complete len:291 (-) Transcript_76731:88-960(-)
MANFVCNIIESQMRERLTDKDGTPSRLAEVLKTLDLAFTIVFAAELAVNMLSNLWSRFVGDGWCRFDFLIGGLSLTAALLAAAGPCWSRLRHFSHRTLPGPLGRAQPQPAAFLSHLLLPTPHSPDSSAPFTRTRTRPLLLPFPSPPSPPHSRLLTPPPRPAPPSPSSHPSAPPLSHPHPCDPGPPCPLPTLSATASLGPCCDSASLSLSHTTHSCPRSEPVTCLAGVGPGPQQHDPPPPRVPGTQALRQDFGRARHCRGANSVYVPRHQRLHPPLCGHVNMYVSTTPQRT